MKTIFEGTVNGVKYNTVQDYNKALMDAVEAGQTIEASSSTRCVPEEDKKTVQTTQVFPFFDLDNFTGDNNRNSILSEDFCDRELSDHNAQLIIKSALADTDTNRDQLAKDYADKIQYFEDAKNSTMKAYEEKLQESKRLQDLVNQNDKELDILLYSRDMLDYEIEFYKKVHDGIAIKEAPTQKAPKLTDEEQDHLDHVRRLLNEIFG